MLDVAFLRERPRPGTPIIYRYRTGLLRRDVRAVFEGWVKAEGGLLTVCKPAELAGQLLGANLFRSSDAGFTVCDWRRVPEKVLKRRMPETLSALQSHIGNRIALFVPVSCSLVKEPLWPAAEASAFMIEEPVITAQTLLPILQYFEESTQLAPGLSLTTQEGFVASFDEFLEEDGNLIDLMRTFEDRVVIRTDPQTHTFDARKSRMDEVQRRSRVSSLSLLGELIATEDPWQLIGLVRCLDERRQQGWTAETLIAEIYRVTRRVLRQGDLSSASEPRHRAGCRTLDGDRNQEYRTLLWASLLLAWENRLRQSARSMATGERRGPNIFAPAVDQFGRLFLTRSSWERDRDGMEGLWPDLHAALATVDGGMGDRVAVARERAVRSLAVRLRSADCGADRSWLVRLRRIVSGVVEEADRAILKREDELNMAREWKRRRNIALRIVGGQPISEDNEDE